MASREECECHYRSQASEGGVESRCRMWLPATLEGASVLDVGCRRGKGAFKLAESVGPKGFVLGVDWRAPFLEEAREDAVRARAKCACEPSPVDFLLAYPEFLSGAGVEAGSFDVAVANSVLNASWSLEAALAEIARALRPGGLFHFATLVRETPLDERDRARAARRGDVVGSALSMRQLVGLLSAVGFTVVEVVDDDAALLDEDVTPGLRQVVVSAWTPTRARAE